MYLIGAEGSTKKKGNVTDAQTSATRSCQD